MDFSTRLPTEVLHGAENKRSAFVGPDRMKPDIHKFGRLIEDVTAHSATRQVVEGHARGIDAPHDPQLPEIFATKSSFTGEILHRTDSLMNTTEEIGNTKSFVCFAPSSLRRHGSGFRLPQE